MATKDDIASIIIRGPQDTAIGINKTEYDIILLPQASGVEDGGRVISAYNGWWADQWWNGTLNVGSDAGSSFGLTLDKADAYLSIGGNYVDNFYTYALVSVSPADSKKDIYEDNEFTGPGNEYCYIDAAGNKYLPDTIFKLDVSGQALGSISVAVENDFRSVAYVMDANYNIHHLAYNAADKANGGVHFTGTTGTLVLTAQNGAKNSADYDESKYKNYYNLTIDLNEFENVESGNYLYYSVDGGELKRILVDDSKKVAISGDADINKYSKVEWFVAEDVELTRVKTEQIGYSEDFHGLNLYTGASEGCLYYSINGDEYKLLLFDEDNPPVISGDELNLGDTVKWYVGSFDRKTDNYTINDVTAPAVQEYSAEYRKNQLRIDATSFVNGFVAGNSFEKLLVKYTIDDGSNVTVHEAELVQNKYGLYEIVLDEPQKNSVISWQIVGVQQDDRVFSDTFSVSVNENGNLDPSQYDISYKYYNNNTVTLDLSAYFADVTDFDKPQVAYKFNNKQVYRGEDGGYYVDITVTGSEVVGKLTRHYDNGRDVSVSTVDSLSDVKISWTEKYDLTDAFENITDFDDENVRYTFAGEDVCFEDGKYYVELPGSRDSVVSDTLQRRENTGTDELVEDIAYLSDLQAIVVVSKRNLLISNATDPDGNGVNNFVIDLQDYIRNGNFETVARGYKVYNTVFYTVTDQYGNSTQNSRTLSMYYDAENDWYVDNPGNKNFTINLGDAAEGSEITELSVVSREATLLSTYAYRYPYTNDAERLSDDLEYEMTHYGCYLDTGYQRVADAVESGDVVGLKIDFEYGRTVTAEDGTQSTEYVYDNIELWHNLNDYDAIAQAILNKCDNSEVSYFRCYAYSPHGAIVESLEYKPGEMPTIAASNKAGTVVLDLTDYINRLDNADAAAYTIQIDDVIYDVEKKNGRYTVDLMQQFAGNYIQFEILQNGTSLGNYTVDNIGGSGATDFSVGICNNQMVLDFTGQVNEFLKDNTDLELGNLSYNVTYSIGGSASQTVTIYANANGKYLLTLDNVPADTDVSADISMGYDNYLRYEDLDLRSGLCDNGDRKYYDLSNFLDKFVSDYGLDSIQNVTYELCKNGASVLKDVSDINTLYEYEYDKNDAEEVTFEVKAYYTVAVETPAEGEGGAAPAAQAGATGEEAKVEKKTSSSSITFDTNVVYNGLFNFSEIVAGYKEDALLVNSFVDTNNVKIIITNDKTNEEFVFGYNDDFSAIAVGSIGDVFSVKIVEDDITLKSGDTFIVSGADQSITAITSKLHTQIIEKTDDKIALRADGFGIYGADFTSGSSQRLQYVGKEPYKYSRPGDTLNYTILADKTLVVESDLAGSIESNVAAVHFGYDEAPEGATISHVDDANNRKIIGAGVKADTIELRSNFRADIDARNSKETFDIAQDYTGQDEVVTTDGAIKDKTIRIGNVVPSNACNGVYTLDDIAKFGTINAESGAFTAIKAPEGATADTEFWIYEQTLYYVNAKKEVVKVGEGIKVQANYERIVGGEYHTFEGDKEYVVRPYARYVYNTVTKKYEFDEKFENLNSDGSYNYTNTDAEPDNDCYITLIPGRDYEIGESMSSRRNLGYDGVDAYWQDRQIYRVEKLADGSPVEVIYLYKNTADDEWYDDTPEADIYVNRKDVILTGTSLYAYEHNDASDNIVENYGIHATSALSQTSGVWAGDILAQTNDVSIVADGNFLEPTDRIGDVATAENNKLNAYGIKVDGTMTIHKIDSLVLDNDGTDSEVRYQNPRIAAEASGNLIKAVSTNDSTVKEAESVKNSVITAAAVHADKLNLDTVTSNALFEAIANDNTFTAILGEEPQKGAGVQVYGIYAKTATFRDFDGQIYVESLGNSGGNAHAAIGLNITTLNSNCNLRGSILVDADVAAFGIKSKNVTVKGVIDTDIEAYAGSAFGIAVDSKITAAGFTGSIVSNVGINVGVAVSNVNNDSFDIAGLIYGYTGFISLDTVNLRVSGSVLSAGESICSEVYIQKNTEECYTKIYNTVANKDYVELTGTAVVIGDIDLAKGINNYSINSNATFVGNILDSAGQANIVYHLEGTPADGHITHCINSYNDQTIYSTNTITLNVNYAEVGTNYQLLKYDLADGNAEEYWFNREVAVMYQGQTVAFKLTDIVEQSIEAIDCSYSASYADRTYIGGVAHHKVYIDSELDGKVTFPETSGIQFGINYSYTNGEGKNVSGYTETMFDEYGNRFFYVAGMQQGDTLNYSIGNDGKTHSYYTGSTTFKDKNGKDVTITGIFTTDSDIFSVQLDGDKDGGAVDISAIAPAISYETLADGAAAPEATVIASSKYDEKNDALTITWNAQKSGDYNLVEIYGYEVEYIVYDQNGNALGASLATRIVGGHSCTINGIDENMNVEWRVRVLGSSSASMSSGWSEWQTDKSSTKPNTVAAGMNLDYNADTNELTLTIGGTAAAEASYVIDYTIYGENNQATIKQVTLDSSNDYKIVLTDIPADAEFRYRISRKDDGWTSLYSDSYHIADLSNTADKTRIAFDYSRFASTVTDANYNERDQKGVIGSIANITFEGLESDVPVRNYIIEYCPITEQITLEDVKAVGATSVEDYIANYFDDLAGDNEVYTKTFTGSSLDISEIQNQTYVYWRIKAVDSNGYESDWISGSTFRVWANAEGDKYAPTFVTVKTEVIGLGYNIGAENNFEHQTTLSGYVGWTKAEDSDSGVKSYVIEFTNEVTHETIVKNIGSEYNTPATVGTYDIAVDEYAEGDEFTVSWNGTTADGIKVSELREDASEPERITGYRLTWHKIDTEYDGAVTISKNGNVFRSDLANGENGYKATIYDYLFDFEGLTGSGYSYKIYALDYFGNKSAAFVNSFTVDSKNPSGLETTVRTTVDEGEITCNIYWSEAEDDNENGVRYYRIRYREKGTEEWIEEIRVASGNEDYIVREGEAGFIDGFNYMWSFNIDPQKQATYEYQVTAYDYFDRTLSDSGNFGSQDIVPPTGFFNPDEYKTEISAKFKEIQVEHEVTDESGNTTIVTETVQGDVESATVKLSWNGEFSDQSELRYVVEVSDDEFFLSSKTYSFWTEGSEEYMIFDNSTPGRPVGIFEGMNNVYWRVTVADEYFNTAAVGTTQSFVFADDKTGKIISTASRPAAPTRVTVRNNEMQDGVHTGKNISLSWQSNNELLGVYSYKIELVNNDTNKTVAIYSTVDTVEYQPTDIKKLVSVVEGTSYATLSIDDLNKIFSTGDKLDDGNYTVKITAIDGAGRSSEVGSVDFAQDTTPPTFAVNLIESTVLPSGEKNAQFILDWTDAVSGSNGSKDIVRYEIYQTADDPNLDSARWAKVASTVETTYSATNATNGAIYYYKIVAYDAAGNRSSDDLWSGAYTENSNMVFNPKNAVDHYNNTFSPATLLEFDASGRVKMPATAFELVGNGDVDCVYFKTGDSAAEKLSLTAGDFDTEFGSDTNIKIEIYKGSPSNLWQTYTFGSEGIVFSDLLLDADTSYYFRVSCINNKSVVAYNLVWDKKVIGVDGGFSAQDDSAASIHKLNAESKAKYTLNVPADTDSTYTDWVGFGDAVDYKLLDIEKSGKYDISLSDVSASAVITVIERVDNGNGTYTEKRIATTTVTQSNLDGKALSNLMLDANKEYFIKVNASNANSIGTSYKVDVKPVETYEAATTDDDKRVKEVAELTTASGWVGYGDATDYHRLEVGENGGVYNFTVEHSGEDTEAVKMVIYEYTGVNSKGVDTFRTVKTVTLAKGAASISTGNLYLTGANKGTYYVEVTATGAAKALNSHYTVKAEGYKLPDATDAVVTREDNIVENAQLLTSAKDWVGIGDTVDYFYVDASEINAGDCYTLTLDGTNGNQIKAAIGYENPKGNFVALQTVTGAANSDSLMLSRKFSQADLDKLAIDLDGDGNPDNRLVIKVFSNGSSANSYYTPTWSKNDIDTFDDKLTVGGTYGNVTVGDSDGTDGWVGLGDAVDFIQVDGVSADGFYCFNLDAAENNLTLDLYEAVTDSNGNVTGYKSVSSAAATVAADGKIYRALSSSKQYYVRVNNAGASSGRNSSYNVTVEKLDTLADDMNGVNVSTAEPVAYNFVVGAAEAGVHSFELDDIAGGQVKISIYNAATNALVKSFTSKAAADYYAFSYNFAEGSYMIKVESADKNGFDKSFDFKHAERYSDTADNVILNKAAKNGSWKDIADDAAITDGWVGLNDVDYIRLDLNEETGSYDINISGLDNKTVVSLLEVTAWNGDDTVKATKTLKSVTATESGVISGVMLDSSKTYFVQVKAASANGTADSNYVLTLDQNEKFDIDKTDDGEFSTPVVIKGLDGNFSTETRTDWVGFCDTVDCVVFGEFELTDGGIDIYDAANVTVELGDFTGTGNVKVEIIQFNSETGSQKVVKTLNLSSSATRISTGDMLLVDGSQYSIRITAPKGASGVNANYSVTVDQYCFEKESYEVANNDVASATALAVGTSVSSAVWLNSSKEGDNVDYYTITVAEDGNYSFELSGISGSNIKVSIGTENPNGAFKSLQSATGVAGQDEMLIVRNLAAGTYLVKVENTGANKSSRYELTAVLNDSKPGFSNADDTWKQVMNNIDAEDYDRGDTISSWVGMGDASDVFKINLDKNGVVEFTCDDETKQAIAGKEISVTLLDSNGKSVALTYDNTTGTFKSNTVLGSDVDYYLNVKNNNTAKYSTNFGITVK